MRKERPQILADVLLNFSKTRIPVRAIPKRPAAIPRRKAKILFPLEIFDAVERDGRDDDQAFDYELQVRVNHQEREAICQACENDYAQSRAADFSDSAVERNAADYTRRDRVHFKTLPCARAGIGAERFQKRAASIKNSRHYEDAQRCPKNADSAYARGFGVAAHGVHIFSERRFVPNEPRHDYGNRRRHNQFRNREASQNPASAEQIFYASVNRADRRSGSSEEKQAVNYQLRGHR